LSDKGTEFRGSFRQALRDTHRITWFSTNSGKFPKIAIAERCIRIIKNLFFRFTLKYRTIRLDNIIKLVQRKYNFHPHSGLFGYSPFQAHFDSHASWKVLERNKVLYNQHPRIAQKIYTDKPHFQKLAIGDRVFVKLPHTPSRKSQAC
jgi:hypothetical protein